MNVFELIKALGELPPNARVVRFCDDSPAHLVEISVVEKQPIKRDLFGPGLHDGVLDEEVELGREFDEVAIYLG